MALSAGTLQRGEHALEKCDRVDVPQLKRAGEKARDQDDAAHRLPEVGQDHDQLAIPAVDQHAGQPAAEHAGQLVEERDQEQGRGLAGLPER